jgi:hypothetical protein
MQFFFVSATLRIDLSYTIIFEVLSAVTRHIAVFWGVTPCSMVVINVSKKPAASSFKVEESLFVHPEDGACS